MQQAVSRMRMRKALSGTRNITMGNQDVGDILDYINDLEARVEALQTENTNLSLLGESQNILKDYRTYRKDRVI